MAKAIIVSDTAGVGEFSEFVSEADFVQQMVQP